MSVLPDIPSREQLLLMGHSQLHDMASLGRVKDVTELIQAGAERDKSDAYGRTPLHLAAALGHDAVVRALSRMGAREQNDILGQAPMHLAAHNGRSEVIAVLLEVRVDVNACAAGARSPLHHAVEGNHPEAIRLLLKLLANPEALDMQKDTPIKLAVRFGHTSALEALIGGKCDLHRRDEEGATALHFAACKQRLDCMGVLVSKGARLEACDTHGFMAIHWAARGGEWEAIERLVGFKANATSRTTLDRQAPLHLATAAEELSTIECLIKVKASIDAQDKRGLTSLHTAVHHNRVDALVKLLELGASRDIHTKAADTALLLACQCDRPVMVGRLMKAGCNPNARGRSGFTGLHISAELGSMRCASTLVDPANAFEGRGTLNVNTVDFQKQTALHIAAWHGHVSLCELLVQSRCEVDLFEDSTPLSLAVSKDHEAAVKTLLRLRADPMRRNPQELAPLQQACVCGAFNVTKTLAEMKMLPRVDEAPWRRPLALATFFEHPDIAEYFFKPCPKTRLVLRGRPAAAGIYVTFSAIIAEPAVTQAIVQCVEVVEVDPKADEWDSTYIVEHTVADQDVLDGKTMLIEGLKVETRYLVRLMVTSDAGTTHGDAVAVLTRDVTSK